MEQTARQDTPEAASGRGPADLGWLGRDCIARQAEVRPTSVACIELRSGRALDYRALDREIARAVGFLRSRLGERGARVALLARNSLHHVVLFYACARAGAVFQPLNWRLSGAEIGVLLADAEPELLIYEAEFDGAAREALGRAPVQTVIVFDPDRDPLREAIAASAPEAAGPLDPEAPCTLLYTSGTTGRPKGAIVTPKSAFFGAYNNRVFAELTDRSVMLCDAPLFHVIGLIANMHAVLHAGGRLMISDRFAPPETLRHIGSAETPVTHYFCVPQMAKALREDPAYPRTDFRHLEAMFCGGAPMPLPLVEAFAADGILALDSYGMTETCGGAFGLPLDRERLKAKLGSAGVAAPTLEVRLVDQDGRDVGVGEVGEVWLRGPSLTPGYWRQPEATAAAFSDGWLRTGDAARVDAEGFYTLVDRWKDMYITGGENVYPAEVERVLLQMPGVAEAAVVGVPHPQWGESGCAYVVASPGAGLEAEAVIGFCATRLARYKRPSAVRFVEALPRTASGKIQKDLLRKSYAADCAAKEA